VPSIAPHIDQPVLVILNPTGEPPRSRQSTLGQVYEAAPAPVRDAIRTATPQGIQWGRTITVHSPIGTATIKGLPR
jgi:hypothetical protein